MFVRTLGGGILAKQAELAIVDIDMPGMYGIEAIRRLRSAGCSTKVVVLSSSREDEDVIETLRAGANAYLLKDGPARHLLEAISYVRDGGQYVSPLLNGAGLFARAESPREIAAFSYVVMARRVNDIAERLRFWRRRR